MNTPTTRIGLFFSITIATLSLSSPVSAFQVTPCGQALQLDGDGDWVSVASHAALQSPSEFTVEAWFRPAAARNGRIVSKGDGITGTSARSYDLTFTGSVVRMEFFLGSFGQDHYVPLVSTTNLPPGTWAHAAGSFSRSAGLASLYVNGELVQSRSTTTLGVSLQGLAIRQTSHSVNFGYTPPFSSTFFQGEIDEVRIWSITRSRQQILDNMFVELDAEVGLEGSWHFNGSFLDSTGGHHGSPTGDAHIARYVECTAQAAWSLYGSGLPGTNGVPGIALSANPVVGSSFNLEIGNSSGGSTPAIVVFADAQTSFPLFGGTLLVEPEVIIPAMIPLDGLALPASIPHDCSLCGVRVYMQAIEVDMVATLGLSFTQGLQALLGN